MIDFLISCSGADKNILEHCPAPEIAKYEGIGGTVFFTGLFAMLSGGYALYFVFHSQDNALLFALFFGMIWGLFIFNLDRYIVSSMVKKESFWSDFKLALPRLALAILLAIVISTPLELKLFETEINSQLISIEQNKFKEQEDSIRARNKAKEEAITRSFQPAINALTVQIDNLTKESNEPDSKLSTEIDRLNKLKQDVINEILGKAESGKTGCGRICKEKQSLVEKAEKEVNRLEQKVNTLEQTITSLRDEKTKLTKSFSSKKVELHSSEEKEIDILKQKREKKYDGLAARLEALGKLTRENDTLLRAYIFITLLFFAIETAPIFVKIMANKGPYDVILEEKSKKAITGYTDIKPPPVQPEKKPPEETPDEKSIWRRRYEDTIQMNRERKKAIAQNSTEGLLF
jgi:hypothetical protein